MASRAEAAPPQPIVHPAASERAATGRGARKLAPRSSHGEWHPPADRQDALGLLEAQAEMRVPELVPIRYGRMVTSSFAFFRGAAAVMASDLAPTPATGLSVQLCGDAHLSNFGGFGAPDRTLVFDVNDFDETLPGPWEWDIKRLSASIAIAARERGFDDGNRRAAVLAATRTYRREMRRLAEMRNLDVWYERLDTTQIERQWRSEVSGKHHKAFRRSVAKAHAKDSLRALSKLTHRVDGELRIVSDPPLIVPVEELVAEAGDDWRDIDETLRELLRRYRSSLPDNIRALLETYRYAHAAHKVVGVGSVGTRAFIVLLLGRDDQDPLFLQVKEAQRSVLEPHAEPSAYEHQGERVVRGQRLVQAAGDIFLGWLTVTGIDGKDRDYYVRQLWDWKGSANIESMTPSGMATYGEVCGATLAHAHARSGDRIAIAAYLGGGTVFDEAMADFAEAYADTNERDHHSLREAIEAGTITAREGL